MEKIKTLYGEATICDWVIIAEDYYGYKIGKVVGIEEKGDTFNEDTVLVDTSAYTFPKSRIEETKEYLKKHGSEWVYRFSEQCANEDWSADKVISLAFLGNDIEAIKMFGDSLEASKNFCEIYAGKHKRETEEEKFKRLKKKGTDTLTEALWLLEKMYGYEQLMYMREVVDIHAVQEAIFNGCLSDGEVEFLLQFEEPLKALMAAMKDISNTEKPETPIAEKVKHAVEALRTANQEWLAQYPYVSDIFNKTAKATRQENIERAETLQVKKATGFAPCDDGANSDMSSYKWFKVNNQKELDWLTAAYPNDTGYYQVKRFPEYICVEYCESSNCADSRWTDLSGCKDYVEKLFTYFDFEVTIVEKLLS